MSISLKPIKKIPETRRQRAESDYDKVLKQFLEGHENFAEVNREGVKPISLASALRSRVSSDEEFKDKVIVRTRTVKGETKVYLEKLESKA